MATGSTSKGSSRAPPFVQAVLSHFGWLQHDYHFRVSHGGENEVVFATPFCQVMVAQERGDVFVELASNEPEPIRRIRFSLNELLAAKSVDLGLVVPRRAGRDLPNVWERLRIAAALLAKHGGEVLAGDFTIRPRIVEGQVRAWLEAKYQDVVEKRRYPTFEEGFQQVAWELSRQAEEKKSEARRQLGQWLAEAIVGKRGFAESVLASQHH